MFNAGLTRRTLPGQKRPAHALNRPGRWLGAPAHVNENLALLRVPPLSPEAFQAAFPPPAEITEDAEAD